MKLRCMFDKDNKKVNVTFTFTLKAEDFEVVDKDNSPLKKNVSGEIETNGKIKSIAKGQIQLKEPYENERISYLVVNKLLYYFLLLIMVAGIGFGGYWWYNDFGKKNGNGSQGQTLIDNTNEKYSPFTIELDSYKQNEDNMVTSKNRLRYLLCPNNETSARIVVNCGATIPKQRVYLYEKKK